MFSLYLDEDSHARALVDALRRHGFDCLTVNEAEMRGATDADQLRLATSAGRVLYTRNVRDFVQLDRRWRDDGEHHAGIIVLTSQRTPVGVQVGCLVRLAEELSPSDMLDRLEFLLNHG